MVVVAQDALLSAPFVNLALVPEAASSLLAPARIGHVRAFELFVLGQSITGARAVELGLANAALPAHEVKAAALAYAHAIAAKPPASVAATKTLMRDADLLRRVMDEESLRFMAQLASAEAREAFRAFAERRPPDFSNLSEG
jgi:enoyl-CoA hydratase/carnithine racemase